MQLTAVLKQLRTSCDVLPEPFAFEVDRKVNTRPAAVVVPIIDHGNHATILLTKRTAHLSAHAGEISFPGGMWEEGDESLLGTALRECEEELGIAATDITVIGQGRGRITGTGFHITPFLVVIKAPITLKPDPFEVEEAFEVPLELAMQAASYERVNTTHQGIKRSHDVLPYGEYYIWGATAGILRDVCRMINGEKWEDPQC